MWEVTSRPASYLESLPVELIRKIFFECLEINLPRASLYIAQILSDEHVYTWLIRVAFCSLNESSRTGFFTPSFLPSPLDFFAVSSSDRTRLQASILGCRWCTLPLMRKCQREYIEHVIRLKCRNLRFAPEDRKKLTNLDAAFSRLGDWDQAPGGRRGKGDLIVAAKAPDANGSDLKVAIWFNVGALQIREPSPIYYEIDLFRLPCCAVENPPRMPRKLLHPPWTPVKLEFLALLATEAYIDEDNSYARSKRVLRQVIRDRDFPTFQRLLGLSIRTKIYNYPFRWPARPSHFRAALRHAEGQNDPFVRFLCENRWGDLPLTEIDVKQALLDNLGREAFEGN
ncbi:hypothetical protein Egran_02003 [Elaphomyces granulatus]|uniref:Uncharacterized protein n=1 Tax=Elaphomyces granulatus TaxID=519963 RepID=A0A232M1N5_9EURO|nr:hypothetical protein Egran_02003 [Elaphomyces granulatus]